MTKTMSKMASKRDDQRTKIYAAAIEQLESGTGLEVNALVNGRVPGISKGIYYRLFDDTDDMIVQMGLWVIEMAHPECVDVDGFIDAGRVRAFFDDRLGAARAVLAAMSIGLTSLKIRAELSDVQLPGVYASVACERALQG